MNDSGVELERIYRRSLEQSIIEDIALQKNINYRFAAEAYYRSRLAWQISAGEYGVQYLDHHVLVKDLIENESELFPTIK